ncbi:MAG: HTH-type transcriptional repressor Bm3R1 [Actinomycetia bacterium]|nr:HTH-type transcriptional repressor Bm3R1 [Actinomycetes bacterium]
MSTAPWPEDPELPVLPGSPIAGNLQHALKAGRHGLPPDAVAANQRERLINAFARVAAENGYAHTTISQVTDTAGVSKKTFYVHFPSLEECFLAAYEHGSKLLLAQMFRAYNAETDWRDAVREALRTLFRVLAAEPAFARISVIETSAAGHKVRSARIRVTAGYRDFLIGPAMPRVPGVIRDSIIGGIYSTIYSYIEMGRTADLPELVPAMTYFALLPFLDRDEAAKELDR